MQQQPVAICESGGTSNSSTIPTGGGQQARVVDAAGRRLRAERSGDAVVPADRHDRRLAGVRGEVPLSVERNPPPGVRAGAADSPGWRVAVPVGAWTTLCIAMVACSVERKGRGDVVRSAYPALSGTELQLRNAVAFHEELRAFIAERAHASDVARRQAWARALSPTAHAHGGRPPSPSPAAGRVRAADARGSTLTYSGHSRLAGGHSGV